MSEEEEKPEKDSSAESEDHDLITIISHEDQETQEKKPPNDRILEYYIPNEGSGENSDEKETSKAPETPNATKEVTPNDSPEEKGESD